MPSRNSDKSVLATVGLLTRAERFRCNPASQGNMASLLHGVDVSEHTTHEPVSQMNIPRIQSIRRAMLPALLVASLLAAFHPSARAADEQTYEMGFRNITNLNADLLLALDKEKRRQVSSHAVLLPALRLPCAASHPESGAGKSGGPVCVSAGFVEFINRIAHARAIDESNRGYFGRYTTQISRPAQTTSLPELGPVPSKNEWNLQTMNRQASYFNQMAGSLVAIDLAHQYLGHYRKYAQQLPPDSLQPMPINAVITEQEWRTAVLRGARNALDCGLGVEGLKVVFECFDQMPSRPAWACYFIHPKANASKMNAELVRLERDFFAMNHQMQKGGRGR